MRIRMKLRIELAALVLLSSAMSAETHHFEPVDYHNTFSFAHQPVLWIKPGDTVVVSAAAGAVAGP